MRAVIVGSLSTLTLLAAICAFLCCGGPELGEAPFLCNSGQPRCPEGYACVGKVCVLEGTCPASLPECQHRQVCGDGTCDPAETTASCPSDCPATCGNGVCDLTESADRCPRDCASSCGNGACELAEDPTTCARDCAASCGNGSCDAPESHVSCAKDCPASCGDGACDLGETPLTCAKDCAASCGNGSCDAGESNASCAKDCPAVCGNGACDLGETPLTCAKDCAASCGNGACDAGESHASCAKDCSACGDGTCDPGEVWSCPADCGGACSGDAGQCDGGSQLRLCEGGVWKTRTCDDLCKATGYDFSSGCGSSSTQGKDACVCGKLGGFGAVCDDKAPCGASLVCLTLGGKAGFCTRYCSGPAGCSGAPSGSACSCSLPVAGQSQSACVFTCNPFTPCPTGLTCDLMSLRCVP